MHPEVRDHEDGPVIPELRHELCRPGDFQEARDVVGDGEGQEAGHRQLGPALGAHGPGGQRGEEVLPKKDVLKLPDPTTNCGMQKWKLSWNIRIHSFSRLGGRA